MTDIITNIDDLLNNSDFSVEIDDLSHIEEIEDNEFPPLKPETEDEGNEEDETDDDPVPPSKVKVKKEVAPIEDNPPANEDENGEDEEVDEDDIHSTFEMVAKGLSKLGKFGEIPKGTKLTQEKFLELYDNFTKEQAYSQVEDLITGKWGDEGMRVFQDIFVKGVSPKEYLSRFQKAQDFQSLELEDNIYNQKHVIREYLSGIDWEDDDIEEHIDTLIESKKLEGMANNYKEKLVKKQKAETDALVRDQEQKALVEKQYKEKRLTDLSKVIADAVKEREINGVPLTSEDGRTLVDYMTSDAYRLPSGQVITEFDKDYLELKKDPVKFAALAKLVKDGLNIKPIKEKGIDELEERAFNFRSKKKASGSNGTGGYDFLDKFLK